MFNAVNCNTTIFYMYFANFTASQLVGIRNCNDSKPFWYITYFDLHSVY